ncbi:unnamed protein product [Periconia digitata]|uniref:Uncharacterized protein n=1 Tax=Periconia digitata TaxID=1303443 RepID=A0A9W4U2L0_9PLEO|nr:unnamed protein product [Periconia digitata]
MDNSLHLPARRLVSVPTSSGRPQVCVGLVMGCLPASSLTSFLHISNLFLLRSLQLLFRLSLEIKDVSKISPL